jgi:hypothetical protein
LDEQLLTAIGDAAPSTFYVSTVTPGFHGPAIVALLAVQVQTAIMPRKSPNELAIVPVIKRLPQRLRPPDSLSNGARQYFISIVADEKPEHFKASDLPLLCQYCEASAMAETAMAELWNDPDSPTNWMMRWQRATHAMSLLSLRLRLSPQARQPNNPKRQNLSYYERRALEGPDDDIG